MSGKQAKRPTKFQSCWISNLNRHDILDDHVLIMQSIIKLERCRGSCASPAQPLLACIVKCFHIAKWQFLSYRYKIDRCQHSGQLTSRMRQVILVTCWSRKFWTKHLHEQQDLVQFTSCTCSRLKLSFLQIPSNSLRFVFFSTIGNSKFGCALPSKLGRGVRPGSNSFPCSSLNQPMREVCTPKPWVPLRWDLCLCS